MTARINPGEKHDWQVVVGNLGSVYSGANGFEANKTYLQSVKQSRSGEGSAAGQDVVLMKDGEISKQYAGVGVEQENPRGGSSASALPYCVQRLEKDAMGSSRWITVKDLKSEQGAKRLAGALRIHGWQTRILKRGPGGLEEIPTPNPSIPADSHGIKFVLGIKGRGPSRKSEVQSVLFDKGQWTAADAKSWLLDHGYKAPAVDKQKGYLRFRQQASGRYKEWATIEAGARQAEARANPRRAQYKIVLAGWTPADADIAGYHLSDYFGTALPREFRTYEEAQVWIGEHYQGPDKHGVEPRIAIEPVANPRGQRDSETVDVIFRRDNETGDVFAVFPGLPATSVYDVTVYDRVGGHGAGSMPVITETSKPARSPSEYGELKDNLERVVGYKLRIVQKETKKHRREREQEIKAVRGNPCGRRNPRAAVGARVSPPMDLRLQVHLNTTLASMDHGWGERRAAQWRSAVVKRVRDIVHPVIHGYSATLRGRDLAIRQDGDMVEITATPHAVGIQPDVGYWRNRFHELAHEIEGQNIAMVGTTGPYLHCQVVDWSQGSLGRAKRKRNPDTAEAMYETFHGKPPTAVTTLIESEEYRKDLAYLGDLIEMKIATPTNLEITLGFDGGGERQKNPEPWQPLSQQKHYASILALADQYKRMGYETKVEKHGKATWVLSVRATPELLLQRKGTRGNPEDRTPTLYTSPDGRQFYLIGGDQSVDLTAFKMSQPKWVKDLMVLGVLTELTYRAEKAFHNFRLSDYYHRLGEETGYQPVVLYDTLNEKLLVAGGAYETKDVGITD
jgi:hypothetical protein